MLENPRGGLDSAIRWLKASYVAGAVADGLVGILMLLPGRMGEQEFRYAMGLGTSLMFGWTLLLVWGYRQPLERKGVLLLTIFPVITGLLATGAYQVVTGAFPLARVLPSMIVGIVLIVLMGFSYFQAKGLETKAGGGS